MGSKKTKKGYTQVYTGNGKGKTTAAIGLAIRAAGAGLKVFIAQFIKMGDYSEIKALKIFRFDYRGAIWSRTFYERQTDARRHQGRSRRA